MLDIKLIREKPELVLDNIAKRNEPDKVQMVHDLIELDKEKREVIQETEQLKKKRNTLTKKISELKKDGKDASSTMREVKELPQKIKEMDDNLEALEHKCKNLLYRIPNLLHDSVPAGKDDSENKEVKKWGEKNFTFEPKDHLTVAEGLEVIDMERAAKVAGHGFYYLKGKLAILEQAIIKFALDALVKKGFTVIYPPLMLRREAYEGVVDLKDFEDVMYKNEDEELYFIATSEHPMAAMYMNETLLKDRLPIKFAGISPCFRKEVGAHGKYTKGLFRVHHFNKIEQFVFSDPKDSWKIHEELQRNSEELYEALGIPYRVVNVCTGDIGLIAAKKYDTEFLMADGNYREIGSNSNCTDYQARRLNVKYREKEGQSPAGFVHTLNNTALPTSRAMVAILENYQQEDGTVKVPKVLVPYTGFEIIESG